MLSEKDILMHLEHYEDLLHQAKQERIIRPAVGHNRPFRLYEWVHRWLGLYFVAWRCYLQRRDACGVFDGKEVSFHGLAAVTCDGE